MTVSKFSSFSGLTLVLLLMMNFVISGQDTLSKPSSMVPQTLFGSLKINTLGLYVAPEIQYGRLSGSYTGFRGISAMVLFDQKLAIGASVSHNALNFRPKELDNDKLLRLSTRTIGAKIEYTIKPYSLVHITFPVTFGLGIASVDSVKYVLNSHEISGNPTHGFGGFGPGRYGSNFGFIQPGIHAELNIFKYGKFYVGGSYRIATHINNRPSAIYELTTKQLNGVNLEAGLKLGLFSYKVSKDTKEL